MAFPLYPGGAKNLIAAERRRRREAGAPFAFASEMAAAIALGGPARLRHAFELRRKSAPARTAKANTVVAEPARRGDVILARRDVADQLSFCRW